MTLTIASADLIGAGTQFTYAANGDQFFIREGVMVASTSVSLSPIGATFLTNLALTIAGNLTSLSTTVFSGSGADVAILSTGSFTCFQSNSTSSGLFFSGADGTFTNYGTFHTPDAAGVATRGANTSLTNYGDILATSPIFVFLANDSRVMNGGTITATTRDDANQTERLNNGIFVENSLNVSVTNLAGGVITATGTTGGGVVFGIGAGDGLLNNAGTIVSLQDFGVRLDGMEVGDAQVRVFNTGTISGFDGAYLGSVNADALTNRGLMTGDVDMGGGADNFDNRNGTVEGDVRLGGGDDTFDTRGGSVSGEIDGGAGNDLILSNTDVAEVLIGGDGTVDILDMRFGPGAIVALDGAFENAGSALGDVIGGFEYLFGSFAEADNLRGNGLGNFLFSFGGADVLDGAGGDDVLRGGTGQDTLTGGVGNDAFRYFTLTEMGDVITDFSSIGAGNNDTFQFSAAAIGGGLAVGILDAAFFQTRADNLAQDANDRFIFRTTDRTLWFDADGSGAGAARLVADLQASAIVANHDILILA